MKKVIASVILILLVLAGCTAKKYSLEDGLYALNTTKNGYVETPYLLINSDDFNMILHDAVSYQPSGKLERNGNEVLMKSVYGGEEYLWVFKLTDDNTLTFDSDKSLPPKKCETGLMFTLLDSNSDNQSKTTDYQQDNIKNNTRITLTEAKAFIKNGDKAKLSDFDKYEHRGEGAGLYIYRLPLAENNGELVVASGGGEIVYMDLYNETARVIDSYFRDTSKFNTKADISEEQAERFARLQLKEDYGDKAEGFVLESVTLYQANEGQFIITSNPYYEVTYSDTNEISYFVNYFVDSSTGEIIWSNTISD